MGIKLETEGDTLRVQLTGFDRLFSLQGELDVPLSHIQNVDVVERTAVDRTPGTWLRAPGTHIPGLIRHGSYGRKPRREFWAAYRQRNVLVISVENWDYTRLVLGVRDAPLLAGEVRMAAEAHHPLTA